MNGPLKLFQTLEIIRDAISLLGFVVGIVLWRRLDRSHRMIAWWLLTIACLDYVGLRIYLDTGALSVRYLLVQFWFPMSAPLTMGALGAYQGSLSREDIFRLIGLGYVFTWGLLLFTKENLGELPVYTSELHTLLLIAAAAFTLVRRSSLARRDLWHDPGFLLSAALLIFAMPTLFFSAISRQWRVPHPDWLYHYLEMQSLVTAGSVGLMIYGMILCARSTTKGTRA